MPEAMMRPIADRCYDDTLRWRLIFAAGQLRWQEVRGLTLMPDACRAFRHFSRFGFSVATMRRQRRDADRILPDFRPHEARCAAQLPT